MPFRNPTIKIVTFFSFLAILSSCSTEKNSFINRVYHNTTARYNGYFNANVLIDEAMDSYKGKVKEDYNKILDPDLFPDSEDVPAMKPNLDTAISKCTKVIVKHSMPSVEKVTDKTNEYCRWIDDNWFVIGYANYIKRNYPEAVEKLKFIANNKAYKDEETIYLARIYLAKTYTAMGKYRMAQQELDIVNKAIESTAEYKEAKKDRERPKSKYQRKKARERRKEEKKKRPVGFPKKWKVDYEVASAELYIAKEEYKKAIEHLEKAIDMCGWQRKRRARYTFVLAQLYRKVGNGSQASYHFNEVVHSPAKYTMRFQAQIKKALAATSGTSTIARELQKLLKDPKNAEFKDQIYFALAELEVKGGNMAKAKEYFSSSVLWSINNDRQKGVSYLRLGNIAFDEKDYVAAQRYYDSCIQVLPEEYESYEAVKGKAEGLTDLVDHYETYVFEDSVQRIGNMSEKEREKFLERTLKEMKEAAAKRKAAEEARLLAQQERISNQVSNSGSGSKWYFYNQKIKGSGFNDFRSLWGQRELEDDWRRSTKRSSADFSEDEEEIDSLDLTVQDVDSLTIDDLMKNIPLGDSAMTASIDRLMNSMYMLGIIYKEQLKEIGEATKYFQKVVDEGVEHPKVLPALYQLYLIKKGGSGGDAYKKRILTEYPDSEIAQILTDPDYLKKKEEREKANFKLYSATYEDYRFRRYKKVLAVCDTVINNDTTNQFLNKYYLLKAFCLSYLKNGNQAAIAQPLEELIALDPESEEGKQAQIYLGRLIQGQQIVQNSTTEGSDYIIDDDSKHYFVVVFPMNDENFAKSKIKLSNFNRKYFSTEENIDIIASPLGSVGQILRVKTFDDKAAAKEYYDTYNSAAAKSVLMDMPKEYDHFIINLENFKRLSTQGDVSGYMDFHSQNYQ